ncbi:hypothetical protein [Devosia sp. DBB001]|nr:hypothetical protein [Devosia sp. DBB001]
MVLLTLRPRAFRTRNPGRDAETDSARFETIRNAISMALEDARRERDGLQQRIDMHYAQAATVLDNSDDYAARDPHDEAMIRSAEQNASNGRKRLVQLDNQIQQLNRLLSEVDGTAQPQTDAGALA